MDIRNIDKLSKQFIKQELYITVGLTLIGLLIMRIWFLDKLLIPLVVSALYTLVVSTACGLIWRRVATHCPDSLPTYYTASSGFRMLLALAVMLVYYLIAGRSSMLVFILVFMTFYLVSLAHHSIFFARVSNRS